MKAVVWNMDWRRSKANWRMFQDGELACDIALLNEAVPPPADLGLNVETAGKTVGRDDRVHGGKKTARAWAAAVVSPHELTYPDDVWTLSPRNEDRRSKLAVSRPGSWAAAVVSLPGGESVTAISLYGLLDERSDASVHRSLSDLTPLFEDKRYNELVLLGGDLNTLTTDKVGSRRLARNQGVLDRIVRGFGMKDLLHKTLRERNPERGRLENCRCDLGDDCRHSWTYRKSGSSAVAYQDDYLFASPGLEERLEECVAHRFRPGWPSDHVPIVATFAS